MRRTIDSIQSGFRRALSRRRRSVEKQPSLSPTFSMPSAAWDSFLGRLIATFSASTPGVSDIAISRPTRCCWVLVSGSETDPNGIAATFHSATELNRHADFAVGLILVGATGSFAGVGKRGPAGTVICRHAKSFSDAVADLPPTDLLLFLRAGDTVHPAFALAVRHFKMFERSLALVDLSISDAGEVTPIFLPGVNFCHALNCDYFRSRFVARVDLVNGALKGPREQEPRDIALHIMSEAYAAEQQNEIVHADIPVISIVDTTTTIADERQKFITDRREAVFPMLADEVVVQENPDQQSLGKVSIVICTKDKGLLLRQLVTNVLSMQDAFLAEIIIVANDSTNAYAICNLAELRERDRVTVINYAGAFNFSKQSNLGAQAASGEFLLFLNDDIVPVTDDWLYKLLLPFKNPRVAITSPLLIYPDERIQHAGMYIGYKGVAGHTLRNARLPEQDYMFLASVPRFVSVVSGAAMMVRRQVFERVGGFDVSFATYIQDVDLCLRIGDLRYDIILNPQSILIHVESPSIRPLLEDELFRQARMAESEIFCNRWGDHLREDPFHNSNFDKDDESLRRLRPV